MQGAAVPCMGSGAQPQSLLPLTAYGGEPSIGINPGINPIHLTIGHFCRLVHNLLC